MIILKNDGVRLKILSPALAYIFYRLSEFHEKRLASQPDELVITSINDSNHMVGSKHYINEAIDLRSKNFKTTSDKIEFALKFQDFLGSKFRIILEHLDKDNEHFHIQVRRGLKFP